MIHLICFKIVVAATTVLENTLLDSESNIGGSSAIHLVSNFPSVSVIICLFCWSRGIDMMRLPSGFVISHSMALCTDTNTWYTHNNPFVESSSVAMELSIVRTEYTIKNI